jgi:hypothetical protein
MPEPAVLARGLVGFGREVVSAVAERVRARLRNRPRVQRPLSGTGSLRQVACQGGLLETNSSSEAQRIETQARPQATQGSS